MDLNVKSAAKKLRNVVHVVNRCGIAVKIAKPVIGLHINRFARLPLNPKK